MSFYTVRLPKKLLIMGILIFFVLSWAFFKVNNSSMETLSKTEPIYQGSNKKKVMAFTCNVAWGNEYIPELLKVFTEKDVKITFFIEGRWAKNFPELLELIYSKGHEIGNHGYSHAHHASLTLEQNINEIQKAEDTIKKVIGKKTNLFAPPYGEFSDETVKAVNKLNYKLIMWTIDTIDWKKPGIKYITNKVIENAGNGKIVLIHPTEDTVKAMPFIIENLQQQGYKIVSVGDMLQMR
jgi:probable sporulation protein (polysaccharide deacetylase family)